MKRFVIAALAALIALAPASAQTKKDIRLAKKEAKKAAKVIKKDGYKMVELGTLEYQLEVFFTKTRTGCHQVVGTAEGCQTKNIALTIARNNAANAYATEAGGRVKGRIASSVTNIDDVQLDEITAAYERLVDKEINGELQQSVTLLKENKKGKNKTYDAKVYFLVDIDAAHQARKRAMELALQETQLAQKYGSAVSDWISEGFAKED